MDFQRNPNTKNPQKDEGAILYGFPVIQIRKIRILLNFAQI